MTQPTDPVGDAIAAWAELTEPVERGPAVEGPAGRSVRDGAVVELREVTSDTVRDICRLVVAPAQRRFVAPNAVSLAEALFEPKAWYRAIVADDHPVGFAMLYDDPGAAECFLWRLMIAAPHQGLGYGRRGLELVVEVARSRPGVTELKTSWVPGDGSPEGFYLAFGFEPTGEIDEGEIVGRLAL